jgi:GNAT superfamily N-acetyltransferase
VAKRIKCGEYTISRIGDVPYMDVYSVADRVRRLLRYHSIGPSIDMTAEEIIKTPIRFYVFATTDEAIRRSEIIGVIGVNTAEAEVVAAAVDRRYRRLGVLRTLVNVVKDRLGRPLRLPDYLGDE